MTWSVSAGLEGKGVVVTGAAGGIGRAVAAAFSSAGARVCAVDLDQHAVDEVVASLEEPGRHISIASDLADLATHEPLLSRAMKGLGRLDVLAHVAGVLRRRGSISEVTEDDWDAQLDTNLKAGFFLNRAAAGLMREQGRGGRIINFTSQGWLTGAVRRLGGLRRQQRRDSLHESGAGQELCRRRDLGQHGRTRRRGHPDDERPF